MECRGESAPKCVPPVPTEGLVQFEKCAFGLVFGFRLATLDALFDSRSDDALARGWPGSSACRCRSGTLEGRERRVRPFFADVLRARPPEAARRDRCFGASGFWFVDDGVPDGTLNAEFFPVEVVPAYAAYLTLAQSSERRDEDNRPRGFGKNVEDRPDLGQIVSVSHARPEFRRAEWYRSSG